MKRGGASAASGGRGLVPPRENKKPLKRFASRTGADPRRDTTLIRASPHEDGLMKCQHTPALSRALPSRPMPCGSRRRNSKTMFGRPFRTPFHLSGLSLTYRPAYSSLHRLFGCSVVEITLQFTRFPPPCQRRNEQKTHFPFQKIPAQFTNALGSPAKFCPKNKNRIARLRQNCYYVPMRFQAF